ncbi:hypothetical protein LG634_29090 [Streptomyces bambusae]|uniref:hypothetical protein n=1 Tax=Streptomyces bambusae TaxID=1550616 RepID=UPI001CFEC2F4|nr:hypothetical protein [Streptomyces bambusae]MCB5168862.1 hypothetical protein [Streptomyces bambusae]
MNHDVLHVFDATPPDSAQRDGFLRTRHAIDELVAPAPAPDHAACTLTLTLRDSHRALGRIAATLSSIPVLALSYAVTGTDRATVRIQVPQAHAPRARAKLNRMVDALTVTEQRPALP